jgi:hypothetical protein
MPSDKPKRTLEEWLERLKKLPTQEDEPPRAVVHCACSCGCKCSPAFGSTLCDDCRRGDH